MVGDQRGTQEPQTEERAVDLAQAASSSDLDLPGFGPETPAAE